MSDEADKSTGSEVAQGDVAVHTGHNKFSPYELYTSIPKNLTREGAPSPIVNAVLTNPANFDVNTWMLGTNAEKITSRNKQPIETPDGESVTVAATIGKNQFKEGQTDYSVVQVTQQRDGSYKLVAQLGSSNEHHKEKPVFTPGAVLTIDAFRTQNIAMQFRNAVRTAPQEFRNLLLNAINTNGLLEREKRVLTDLRANPTKNLTEDEVILLALAVRELFVNVVPRDVPAFEPTQSLVRTLKPLERNEGTLQKPEEKAPTEPDHALGTEMEQTTPNQPVEQQATVELPITQPVPEESTPKPPDVPKGFLSRLFGR